MACETHAGDEGISVGIICIQLHPPIRNCSSQAGCSKASSGLSVQNAEQKQPAGSSTLGYISVSVFRLMVMQQ